MRIWRFVSKHDEYCGLAESTLLFSRARYTSIIILISFVISRNEDAQSGSLCTCLSNALIS